LSNGLYGLLTLGHGRQAVGGQRLSEERHLPVGYLRFVAGRPARLNRVDVAEE
jgi:hypothetical protein